MRVRRWMSALVVLGALALLGVWLSRGGGPPGTTATSQEARSTEREAASRAPTALAPRRTGAGLRIQGTVVDLVGRPVAGVSVSASRAEPGQTLSELLPCPEDAQALFKDTAPEGVPLSRCLGLQIPLAMQQATELLAAREGEASVHAESITAEDGSFVLEGLPEGPLSLWALGEQGAAVRPGIPAGSEGVELLLQQGFVEAGTVLGEGVPLAGASVTVVVDLEHPRFFDTTTGPDGRYRIGPLPRYSYDSLVFVSRQGWLPELRTDGPETVTLHRPRQLTGRVVAGGAPVPGVEVRVGQGDAIPRAGARKTLTDAQGGFRFVVSAGVPHTLSASREQRYAMARLEPGDSPSEVLLELGSALHVEGTVRDDARRPVAGARVMLVEQKDWRGGPSAFTDAAGRYSLGPVEPGAWGFVVKAERHLDLDKPDLEKNTLRLAPGMGPVDFILRRASTVSGRVTDPEGRPLAYLPLKLQTHWEQGAQLEDAVQTDAEGRFLLDAKEPGDYLIVSWNQRFLDADFPVRAPSENVHLTLQPGASVTGTVVDAQGLPLEHCDVYLMGTESHTEGMFQRNGFTDSQGHFHIQGMSTGGYLLVAMLQTDGLMRRTSRTVELVEGQRLELELRMGPERTLTGIAVDGAGQPLEGVFVRVRPPQDKASYFTKEGGYGDDHPPPMGLPTGPDGRFLLKYLTEAEYDLSAMKRGYVFVPQRSTGGTEGEPGRLRVGADTAEVRLVLTRTSRMLGRVVGPDGRALPYVNVAYRVVAGPDGAFNLPIEEPVPQWLTFIAEGMAPQARHVAARPDGQDLDLGVVRLSPGREVRGRVVDVRTSAPVKGIGIGLLHRLPSPTGGTFRMYSGHSSSEDGTFVLPHVDLESFVLSIGSSGYRDQRVDPATTPGELTVRLEPEPRDPEAE